MENTIEQKLNALLKLQEIDSNLDAILKIHGDLPEEVRDLEDDVAGYETRLSKFNAEVAALQKEIDQLKANQKDSEKLVAKYKDQQMNVRNNREYDAISKEIELQELDILLSEKKINEAKVKVGFVDEDIAKTQKALENRKDDLQAKKNELSVIISESEEEEKALMNEREKNAKKVEERLLKSYERIRANSINGLAIVNVSRGACGGCFNIVPPQRQADIREHKKIIVCEHCGRIFGNVEAPEPISITNRR